jgi:hypothetical protein
MAGQPLSGSIRSVVARYCGIFPSLPGLIWCPVGCVATTTWGVGRCLDQPGVSKLVGLGKQFNGEESGK